MKTLLAILLSFIVTEAPVLAIHGGYTLGGAAGVIGTYAGVLIPTSNTVLATGTNSSNFGDNALGLFTLSIPETGIGSGQLYLFSGGEQLIGSIQALPDPTSPGGIVGVLQATGIIPEYSVTDNLFGFNYQVNQVTGQASGGLNASVSNSSVTDSPNGVNLDGTANITIDTTRTNDITGNTTLVPVDSIVFAVDGFQQSSVAAASSGT